MPSSFSRNTRNAILVQQTGCFDALTYCVAAQYIENTAFCPLFKQNAQKDFVKYIETYLQNGATYTTRASRNTLLEKHCISEKVNGLDVINVKWSIEEVVRLFLKYLPSGTELFSCGCSKKRQPKPKYHMFVPDKIDNNNCAKCKQFISVERKMNELIFLKEEFSEDSWENIEKEITVLGEKQYTLVGAIDQQIENNFSNFIVHVKRYGSWYTFNKDKVGKIKAKAKLVSPLLIYAASESDIEIDGSCEEESSVSSEESVHQSKPSQNKDISKRTTLDEYKQQLLSITHGQQLLTIFYEQAEIMSKTESKMSKLAQMPITVNNEPFQMDIVEINGDGNCLFQTLAHQIFLNRNGSSELEAQTSKLRKNVTDFIDKNFKMFKNVMEGRLLDEKMEKKSPQSKKLITLPKDTENLRRKLLKNLQKDKFWGGSETIYAVSQIKNK